MRRGLGLILVANLLLLALVFVPESVFRDSFGGGRHVLLYYSTSMWVLAHWGVWKLAAPNRELRDRGMRGAWTKTVRLATWVSMLAPGWYYLAPSLQRAYRVRVPGWTADIGYWSLFAGILCIQFALHVLHRLAVEDRASKWVVYPGAVIQWAVPGILVLTYLTVGARPPEESLEGLLMFPVPLMGCSLVAIFLPQILPEVIRDPWDDLSLILAGIVLMVAAALMSNVIGFIRVRRAISHDR